MNYIIHEFYAATGEYFNEDVGIVENVNSKEEAIQKYIDEKYSNSEYYDWYNRIARDMFSARLVDEELDKFFR